MTHPHLPPAADPRDGAFLRTFFLVLVGALLAVAGVSLLVDPMGVFGTGFVAPTLMRDRDEKARLYRGQSPPPSLIVLGSSRSRTIPPSCLARGLGLPAGFNFALTGAGTEDLLAASRFARQGRSPDSLVFVVGIEPEMFQGQGGVRPALRASRALAPFGPDGGGGPPLSLAVADLIGWQAVEAALASLRVHAGFGPARKDGTLEASDGREVHPDEEDAWQLGSYDGSARIAASVAGAAARYGAFRELDSVRVRYFREFLAESREAGARVIGFIPPVHPLLEQAAAGTSRGARTGDLLALVRETEGRGLLRYVETRDLGSIGADPRAYLDALHFLAPVANAVADAIAGPSGRCAVQ